MHRAAVPLVLLATLAAPTVLAEPLELASIEAPGTYQVGWKVVSVEHRWNGRLDAGDARSLKLLVEQENVTDVSVFVAWREDEESVDVTQDDLFELSVTSPDGIPYPTERGRGGSLAVGSGAINAIPSPLTIEVASADEAYDRLARYRAQGGLGEWRVSVRLADAGNPKGVDADRGNSYEVTVLVRHYEAVLLRVVSLDPPPPMTIAQAAKSAPPAWLWSTAALAAVALGLGGWLARDAWRRRRA